MSRKFIINLVRHGETMANRQKIMQGQMDTPLSDLGIKQAQLLATHLKKEIFTHVFSSDLARAAVTARTIAEANTSFTGQLTLDRRLRERGFGNLEGKSLSDYKLAADKTKVSMQSYTPDGGETMEQVTHRATEFFDELCRLMAEPLINTGDKMSEERNSTAKHGTNLGISSNNLSETRNHNIEKTNADSSNMLHIDIPGSSQYPDPKPDLYNGNTGGSSGTGTKYDVSHSGPSDCRQQNQCSDSSVASVLIVSHGLLLRELKRLILDRYTGKLEGKNAVEAGHICPNTGLSQFIMCVFIKNKKVCIRCDEVRLLNDTSHLASSTEDLVSHAKFQGAL